MESVIEQLYNGNIDPTSWQLPQDPKSDEASDRRYKLYEKLRGILDEDGKALLEDFMKAQEEEDAFMQIGRFSYGLKFGILLMVDVFTGSGEVIGEEVTDEAI